MERGLAVIKAFDAENGRMTLSEVARRTGLTRATARRFLHTLVGLEYMQTDGREFWLRPKILELGYAYLSSTSLPELATPHLKALSELVHESSSVSVLDGTDIVYVARVSGRRIMAVSITVGTRFPAYVTSMGRAMMAGLTEEEQTALLDDIEIIPLTPKTITTRAELEKKIDDARTEGYSLIDQELELGLRSIAVGIRDGAGATIAAINISVPSTSVSNDELRKRLLPALIDARDGIEKDVRMSRLTA